VGGGVRKRGASGVIAPTTPLASRQKGAAKKKGEKKRKKEAKGCDSVFNVRSERMLGYAGKKKKKDTRETKR